MPLQPADPKQIKRKVVTDGEEQMGKRQVRKDWAPPGATSLKGPFWKWISDLLLTPEPPQQVSGMRSSMLLHGHPQQSVHPRT
ncbi:hypothetical protein PR002_g20266 [Phytophthora rubi]|uniref:Uncharacterized protein n=1 Tax=Phytophthora rubi TaxID=129364 RepID=A0A6A3JGS1_9STRA|nr:hypothetical protein PR002_g20266 [Phytophthora rubi]